jgi:VWFA-related protein
VAEEAGVVDGAKRRNLARARQIVDYPGLPGQRLQVFAELVAAEEQLSAEGLLAGRMGVEVSGLREFPPGARWLVTLFLTQMDEEPLLYEELVQWPHDARGGGWVSFVEVSVPEDFQDAVVVVEDLSTGHWGGNLVEPTDELAEPPPGFVVLGEQQTSPTPSQSASVKPDQEPVLRLVPPSTRPVVGRVRFRTVATTDAVRSAVFYLDDERVAVDDRAPFSAVLDLGDEPRPRTIRVEALGSRGVKLGEDSLEINLGARPFRLAIRDVSEAGAGRARIAVDLSVPSWEALDRVEFYRNEELAATVVGPPFEAEIEAAAGPSDFVRVVAFLESGESQEDARLLSGQGVSERIEVNLVEVYAVVTDRDGAPVRDLTRDRFRLKQGRRRIPVERFALADEVPLVLGLIIDTSESMYPLIVETRQAAAQFLTATLLEDDRAFVVDFDTKPRMAQGLTPDAGVLLRSLGRLRAGGKTAIYDATIFSLVQFEREPGRRALVLLTDGRDYGSRFGPKRCIEEARRHGVPIYVIVLNNPTLQPLWWQRKPEPPPPVDFNLENFSRQTGGRLFNIGDLSELGEAYAQINAELRSQYLLAFSSGEPLTEKELRSLDVELDARELDVRTVTLSR